jgi:thioredoxin-like negative regulator of GroEL
MQPVSVKNRPSETVPEPAEPSRTLSSKRIIVLLIATVFLGFIVTKLVLGSAPPVQPQAADSAPPPGTTITSVRNDAVADYDAALESGKPVYVLFHSLTCQPCVEISALVDQVMPDYEDRVVFVNAISDDAPARQLASRFQFQYIPTSFFLAADGSLSDSFTGSMDETKLRGYLDAIAVAK